MDTPQIYLAMATTDRKRKSEERRQNHGETIALDHGYTLKDH